MSGELVGSWFVRTNPARLCLQARDERGIGVPDLSSTETRSHEVERQLAHDARLLREELLKHEVEARIQLELSRQNE